MHVLDVLTEVVIFKMAAILNIIKIYHNSNCSKYN